MLKTTVDKALVKLGAGIGLTFYVTGTPYQSTVTTVENGLHVEFTHDGLYVYGSLKVSDEGETSVERFDTIRDMVTFIEGYVSVDELQRLVDEWNGIEMTADKTTEAAFECIQCVCRQSIFSTVKSYNYDCAVCVAEIDRIARENLANESEEDDLPTSAELILWNHSVLTCQECDTELFDHETVCPFCGIPAGN